MKVMVTLMIDDGAVQTAGFTVYDERGRIVVSERSSGRNVAKRSPAQVLDLLLDQAEVVLSDIEAGEEF